MKDAAELQTKNKISHQIRSDILLLQANQRQVLPAAVDTSCTDV